MIDPDALWACTNCGVCVEECPVDIEHIDHISGLRRHQVLIESAFPVGADVDYLFWVGCAGALEDRAEKTTKAIAALLHTAGVPFAVLGPAETCAGDPARRIGNELVYSMLAQQNIETLDQTGARTIVASCPHCFNTIANEYPQLGGNYEVIHHTQLLARLVEQGRLTPVTPVDGKITYHDPCFLGRHNKVFTPPGRLWNMSLEYSRRKCTDARTAGSAAGRAVPGCGWKNGPAWSCSATRSAPGKPAGTLRKPSKSSTSPRS